MSATGQPNLQGLKVLVTRPAGSAEPLCDAIQRAGGEAFAFPVLEIQPAPDDSRARGLLADFDKFDWAIFVSRNAVDAALRLRGDLFNNGPRLAAIGKATARALAGHAAGEVVFPAGGSTSEDLLAMEELREMDGKRVLIVRGTGGREHLAAALRERGARVEYAEVYRRTRPEVDIGDLLASWSRRKFDLILLTSGEAMDNLLAMLGEHAGLALQTAVLVISGRLAELARERGFQQTPFITREAGDAAILETLNEIRTRLLTSRDPSAEQNAEKNNYE